MGSFSDGFYTGLDSLNVAIESFVSLKFPELLNEEVTLGAKRIKKQEERYSKGCDFSDSIKYSLGVTTGLGILAVTFPLSSCVMGVIDISYIAKSILTSKKIK